MRLADILGAVLKRPEIKGQTEGPQWLGRKAQPVIAVCVECTEQVRRNFAKAGRKYEGHVGWLARDLERHLREFHGMGEVA